MKDFALSLPMHVYVGPSQGEPCFRDLHVEGRDVLIITDSDHSERCRYSAVVKCLLEELQAKPAIKTISSKQLSADVFESVIEEFKTAHVHTVIALGDELVLSFASLVAGVLGRCHKDADLNTWTCDVTAKEALPLLFIPTTLFPSVDLNPASHPAIPGLPDVVLKERLTPKAIWLNPSFSVTTSLEDSLNALTLMVATALDGYLIAPEVFPQLELVSLYSLHAAHSAVDALVAHSESYEYRASVLWVAAQHSFLSNHKNGPLQGPLLRFAYKLGEACPEASLSTIVSTLVAPFCSWVERHTPHGVRLDTLERLIFAHDSPTTQIALEPSNRENRPFIAWFKQKFPTPNPEILTIIRQRSEQVTDAPDLPFSALRPYIMETVGESIL